MCMGRSCVLCLNFLHHFQNSVLFHLLKWSGVKADIFGNGTNVGKCWIFQDAIFEEILK